MPRVPCAPAGEARRTTFVPLRPVRAHFSILPRLTRFSFPPIDPPVGSPSPARRASRPPAVCLGRHFHAAGVRSLVWRVEHALPVFVGAEELVRRQPQALQPARAPGRRLGGGG